MKRNVSFTWSNPGSEIEYHISGVIHPGRAGTRNGFDRFAEPDEPDEFQFGSATMVIGGKVFGESDFSEVEMDEIEAAAKCKKFNSRKAQIKTMSKEIILSDADVVTLVQAGVIPDGTPKAQIAVFAQICKERGLSAFSKEIHLVGYGGRYSVIVGINGFRKIAAESGQHAGTEDVQFNVMPDGSFKTAMQLKSDKALPVSATCTIYRIVSGIRVPFTHTVLFSEFSTGKNKWQEMPFQMIGKVAEAFALRKGFSDRLTGLAIEEEQAAFEGTTIMAKETTRPELSIDVESLKLRIKECATVNDLTILYGSNPMHSSYAELFTDRKFEIEPTLMLAK